MLCAWGVAETGERVLLSVSLGMRESEEDWISLGRDLTARGLPSSLLVVADGAPGLVSAIEQLWPRADRQRCTVHRVRNLLANVRTGQHGPRRLSGDGKSATSPTTHFAIFDTSGRRQE